MNNDLKKIIKNAAITSMVILAYGLLVRSTEVYIGAFIGSLISIGAFYNMYMEAEVAVRSHGAFKVTVTGYLKRYLVYGIYLGVLMKFFGTSICIGGAMGLLNIKFNIALTTVVTTFDGFVAKLNKIR